MQNYEKFLCVAIYSRVSAAKNPKDVGCQRKKPRSSTGVIFILPEGVNLIMPEGVSPACPKGSNSRAFSTSLLGHAGLKHTEKYTRAVDSLKREAIDSLPDISF